MATPRRRQAKTSPFDTFTLLCKSHLKTECVKEYRFHETRKWRFDYALPSYKIAIEIDGGVWTLGRHNRPKGYINDLEKFNEAAALGWLILKFTPQQQYTAKTFRLLKRTIRQRAEETARISGEDNKNDYGQLGTTPTT